MKPFKVARGADYELSRTGGCTLTTESLERTPGVRRARFEIYSLCPRKAKLEGLFKLSFEVSKGAGAAEPSGVTNQIAFVNGEQT